MATNTYYLSPISLLIQIFSNLGIPLQGGFVTIYAAGSTTTLVTTYTDSTGTTQNPNPITLSSSGRLAAASGAPVAVWLAQGVAHKLVITDSAGNFILSLDNLTSIGDPGTLLTLLSTVSTSTVLGGADLVANAMRSYDIVSSVRAAQAPSLASGQTLIIDVEGGVLVNDGLGGMFYWSSTSTATDDGVNVIKPNSITTGNPGRYLRQSNLYGVSGTVTLTATGVSGSPTVAARYVINGTQVNLSIADTGALTSTATTFGLSGLPAAIQGATAAIVSPLFSCEDNGTLLVGNLNIPTVSGGSSITISNLNGIWTASGTKRMFGASFSYVTA